MDRFSGTPAWPPTSTKKSSSRSAKIPKLVSNIRPAPAATDTPPSTLHHHQPDPSPNSHQAQPVGSVEDRLSAALSSVAPSAHHGSHQFDIPDIQTMAAFALNFTADNDATNAPDAPGPNVDVPPTGNDSSLPIFEIPSLPTIRSSPDAHSESSNPSSAHLNVTDLLSQFRSSQTQQHTPVVKSTPPVPTSSNRKILVSNAVMPRPVPIIQEPIRLDKRSTSPSTVTSGPTPEDNDDSDYHDPSTKGDSSSPPPRSRSNRRRSMPGRPRGPSNPSASQAPNPFMSKLVPTIIRSDTNQAADSPDSDDNVPISMRPRPVSKTKPSFARSTAPKRAPTSNLKVVIPTLPAEDKAQYADFTAFSRSRRHSFEDPDDDTTSDYDTLQKASTFTSSDTEQDGSTGGGGSDGMFEESELHLRRSSRLRHGPRASQNGQYASWLSDPSYGSRSRSSPGKRKRSSRFATQRLPASSARRRSNRLAHRDPSAAGPKYRLWDEDEQDLFHSDSDPGHSPGLRRNTTRSTSKDPSTTLATLPLLPLSLSESIFPLHTPHSLDQVTSDSDDDSVHRSSLCSCCSQPTSTRKTPPRHGQILSMKDVAASGSLVLTGYGCVACNTVVHASCIGALLPHRGPKQDLDPSVLERGNTNPLDLLFTLARQWPRAKGWAIGRLSEVSSGNLTLSEAIKGLDHPDYAILLCKWCLKDPSCISCSERGQSVELTADGDSVGCTPIVRCISCFRGWHPTHLPSWDGDKYGFKKIADGDVAGMTLGWCDDSFTSRATHTPSTNETGSAGNNNHFRRTEHQDETDASGSQLAHYQPNWQCGECEGIPDQVESVLGWRYTSSGSDPNFSEPDLSGIFEFSHSYSLLVKFRSISRRHVRWMPASWVMAAVPERTLTKFFRHAGSAIDSMQDSIPWDEVAVDQVLDVEFHSALGADDYDINNVSRAFVTFKAFGLESASWENGLDLLQTVDPSGWIEWERGFMEWKWRQHVRLPSHMAIRQGVASFRQSDFSPVKAQPAWIGRRPQNEHGEPGDDSTPVLTTVSESSTHPSSVPVSIPPTEGRPLPYDCPSALNLLSHQLDGLNWLLHHFYSQTNALLADEMGLGKTIQVAALVAHLVTVAKASPWLIVVPGPTVAGWRREFARWAPGISTGVYAGPRRSRELGLKHTIQDCYGRFNTHVVIANYEAVADSGWRATFRGQDRLWQGLVVDEAQRLKSGAGPLYEALTDMKAPFRVLLSGTPLQNKPAELFSLMRFLRPGHDTEAELKITKKQLERVDGSLLAPNQILQLYQILRPLLLRRTKAVALGKTLPPISSIVIPVHMGGLQRVAYKAILAKRAPILGTVLRGKQKKADSSTGRLKLSNTLMLLRKCLCHPWVLAPWLEPNDDGDDHTKSPANKLAIDKHVARELDGIEIPTEHNTTLLSSPKLDLLSRLLPLLILRKHRVLIFSQFLNMLDLVSRLLDSLEIPFGRIDGKLSAALKQRQIDVFNAPDTPLHVLLLSTRAGGVGLNLATADTVIILDPDFNPYQDSQAIGRAHRIGQKNTVLSIQLITKSSVEEKILAVGQQKRRMEHVLVGGAIRRSPVSSYGASGTPDEQSDETANLDERDLASLLTHGAEELFAATSDGSDDFRGNQKWVDSELERMIDRSQAVVPTQSDDSFGIVRIWDKEDKNNSSDITEISGSLLGRADNQVGDAAAAVQPPDLTEDPQFWDRIVAQHEEKNRQRQEQFGRGKRKRTTRRMHQGNELLKDFISDHESDLEKGVDGVDSDFVNPESDSENSECLSPGAHETLPAGAEFTPYGVPSSVPVGEPPTLPPDVQFVEAHPPGVPPAGPPSQFIPSGLPDLPAPVSNLSILRTIRHTPPSSCPLCSLVHVGTPASCPAFQNPNFRSQLESYVHEAEMRLFQYSQSQSAATGMGPDHNTLMHNEMVQRAKWFLSQF